MNEVITLDNAALRNAAPSVFAKRPWEGVSERYAFIPTIDVVDAMRENGFMPVRASQSLARIEGKRPFTKHMVRFRRQRDIDKYPPVKAGWSFYEKGKGPIVPEIVLTNAHDRSSAYRLDAGIFRFICSNGLMIKSADFGSIYIQHSGGARTVTAVLEATASIISRTGRVQEQIERWRAVPLTDHQRQVFAAAVLIDRYGEDDNGNPLGTLTAESLLATRREEDGGNDLWTTANVVQENLMKGGLEGRSATGRRTRTRAIRGVNAELSVNAAVWSIAEVLAERIAV